jgi:hypothetical protein
MLFACILNCLLAAAAFSAVFAFENRASVSGKEEMRGVKADAFVLPEFASLRPGERKVSDVQLSNVESRKLINGVGLPTSCIAAPTGMVSWWRADDNAWDVMNLNNGLLRNGASFSAGVVGKAFELDGVDDFVQIQPPSTLPVAAAPRSVEFWFRTPLNLSANTESALFQYGTPSSGQMFALITSANAPGRLYFYGHANDLAGATVLQPNTWYHTAVTYDGGTVRIYLNGSLDAAGPRTLNTVLNSQGITIGYRDSSSRWKGQIDEPTLYNRALSAAEVAAIYQAGSLGKCGTCSPAPVGMRALWRAEQNALDSRGSNDGVLQNNVTYGSGIAGSGFHFGGTDGRVLIGDPIPQELQIQNEISLEAWVYLTEYPSGDNMLGLYMIAGSQRDGTRSGASIFIDGRTNDGGHPSAPGHIHFQIGSGGSWHATDTVSPVPLNQWVHIVATRRANEDANIYYNGVSQPLTSDPWTSGFISYSDAWFAIGQQKDVNRPFKGLIDEVAVYDRALTASEVLQQFQAGAIGKCSPTATTPPSGIIRWWGGDGDLKNFSPIFAPLNNVNGVGFFPGKVGQGFRFRRANQTYFWATDNGMPFGDTSRTIEFWARPANNARIPFIYGGFSNAGAFYPLFNGSTACIGSWGDGEVCGSTNVANGNWHHIAMTYSQGDHVARLYVNGLLEATMPRVYNSVPTGSVFVGSSTPAGSNEYYDGDLDEITVYDRQLSQAEIQRIVRAGFAGKLKQVPAPASGGLAARTEGSGYIYVGDAAVNFPTVATAGQLHEIPIALNGLPPLPYLSMGLTYDIATGAEYTGQPTVCFNLPAFTPPEYNGMRILHLENGQWVDRTVTSNTYPVRCAAGMTSLSPFAIAYLTPTAAGVSVSGRVLDGAGRGIINARLTLTDTAGMVRTAVSNSFGYYSFEGVPVGETYVIEAKHRRFRFVPQAVNVNDNISELDLFGME